MEKINTLWDEEYRHAYCGIKTPDGNTVVGEAICHPQDVDMVSEKTGCTIAERRAYIKYMQYQKENILKPELKALKKFYNVVNQSKYYDEQDYTNQMLIRHIKRLEEDIASLKQEIETEKINLRDYISTKDTFYQEVRKRRQIDKQAKIE